MLNVSNKKFCIRFPYIVVFPEFWRTSRNGIIEDNAAISVIPHKKEAINEKIKSLLYLNGKYLIKILNIGIINKSEFGLLNNFRV